MDEEQKKEASQEQPTQDAKASTPPDISEDTETLKKQSEEYLDGWKRAKADLINYKKDEAKRLEEFVKFSNEALVREMIHVLDAFDLALESLKDDSKTEKGVYLIRSKLEDVLKQQGLERIMVSVGKPFDPAIHDAIASVDSDEYESGVVIDEVERGYTMHGKLIRAARVKVAK